MAYKHITKSKTKTLDLKFTISFKVCKDSLCNFSNNFHGQHQHIKNKTKQNISLLVVITSHWIFNSNISKTSAYTILWIFNKVFPFLIFPHVGENICDVFYCYSLNFHQSFQYFHIKKKNPLLGYFAWLYAVTDFG